MCNNRKYQNKALRGRSRSRIASSKCPLQGRCGGRKNPASMPQQSCKGFFVYLSRMEIEMLMSQNDRDKYYQELDEWFNDNLFNKKYDPVNDIVTYIFYLNGDDEDGDRFEYELSGHVVRELSKPDTHPDQIRYIKENIRNSIKQKNKVSGGSTPTYEELFYTDTPAAPGGDRKE
jgi:hypothetical protein